MFTRLIAAVFLLVVLATPAFAKEEFEEILVHNAAGATATGSTVSVLRYSTVALEVVISGTATVSFQGSVKGSAWTALSCTSASSASLVTSATASGIYQCSVAGLAAFSAPVTAFTSGTITVYARATTAVTSRGAGAGLTFDGLGNALFALGTCISGESACADSTYMKTSGAAVLSTPIMSGVTTNTTSATTAIPKGPKSFNATVDGTGAVTATINIYGSNLNSVANTNNVVCTLTLSNTTHGEATCPPTEVNFLYYFAITTNVTGTSATVVATAAY